MSLLSRVAGFVTFRVQRVVLGFRDASDYGTVVLDFKIEYKSGDGAVEAVSFGGHRACR